MPLFLRDYTPLQRAKTLLRCSARKAVKYCDRECQSKDWKFHKKGCALIRSDPKGLGDKMILLQRDTTIRNWRITEHASAINFQLMKACKEMMLECIILRRNDTNYLRRMDLGGRK